VIYPCVELWWLYQLEQAPVAAQSRTETGPALPVDGTAA
jgi:hypothetical protein